MKWNNIKTTIIKEIRGIFRDKKTMKTLCILPLIIPFYIFLMGFIYDNIGGGNHIIGINYELSNTEKTIINEVDTELQFKTYKNSDELKKAYENEEIDAYIVKNDKEYTIYTDDSSSSGSYLAMGLSAYLESYNNYLGNNYLISQDIDTEDVYKNVVIKLETLAEDNKDYFLVTLLSLSISYILMIITQSTATVATDSTAGEKERGTLETLLTFPIKSSEIITGKYLAISLFGIFFGIVSLILVVPSLSLAKVMFDMFEDINTNFSFISIVLSIIVVFIASFLSSGICMALAGNAKTYKEAQSALQFITFFSILPMFSELMELDSEYFSLIPLANCGFALNSILIGNSDLKSLLFMILSSIVYIVLIIYFISKQYKSEKTLFS